MIINYTQVVCCNTSIYRQIWKVMRITVFLLTVLMMQVSAESMAQITINKKSTPLREIVKVLSEQSGFDFVYADQDLKQARPVSVKLSNASLEHALAVCFAGQPLDYAVRNRTVLVRPKTTAKKANLNTLHAVTEPIATRQIGLSGRVLDEKGLPLEGATVSLKNFSMATQTDADGNFMIEIPANGRILVFSLVGFEPQEVTINGRSKLEITMRPAVNDLEEAVVVGYGTQKKSDLTGAISRIDARDFETQSATNLSEFLSGTVAGIASSQSTGAGGGASLEVRGANSITAGTSPLIVLDGVIYNGALQDINPFDIATIDVLQDASSAAVYGSRAASGVIIVTTKRGTSDVPTVTVSSMWGLASTSNDYKPFDAAGYLRFREDLMQQMAPRDAEGYYMNPDQLPANVSLEQWRGYSNNVDDDNTVEWLKRLRLNSTEIEGFQQGRIIDWYDKRMQQGLRHNSDIALSGKGSRVNYYLSTGYTDNEGIIYGDRIKTWRTRLNLEGDVANFFKVGMNAQFASSDNSSVPAGGINRLSPYGRFDDEDGMLVRFPQEDPSFPNEFLDAYYKDQYVKNNRLFATFYAELKLPFGIKYRASFQNRLVTEKNYNFWPSTTMEGGIRRQNGYGNRSDEHSYEWMLDNILTWSQRFNKHAVDFTFLINAEKLQIQQSFQENENFGPNENLSWHGLQYGANPSINNNDRVRTGDALMARMNYNYDERYLFTFSWRRDGFSAFGQNHPRGFFPSAAFAWRLSQEQFFNVAWVDDLKMRFSWGVNGNRDVPTYAALSNLSRNPYFDGTNVVVGLTNSSMANPNLKWEGTEAYNIGVDLTAFERKLTVTLDAYQGTTYDLLLDRRLPRIIGYESVTTNLGELFNRGINATVEGQLVKKENLTWRSSLVFSLNRNRINRLWGDMIEEEVNGQTVTREVPDYANGYFPGEALDRVWDYRIQGIWQEEEADAAGQYGMRPGEYRVEDVNADGAYRQFDDKQFIGWRQPRYTLGWRNDFNFLTYFDLNIFVRADLGHIGERGDFNHSSSNIYDRANTLDIPYWTAENRSNTHPRLNVNYRLFEGGINMYESRSFLRLQDAAIGYRMPQQILEKVSVNQLRFFASARNLLTWSKWSGWDPESQNSPMPRIFTLGLNASF
ncbi:SusC/RagA family TonB-linked outer membrane protein [Sphingobacterium sp. Ka21]|uniref:SusC/RagA family TonB-linked outer membrane protein n=2 Tax=Sphingobacterium pedocola TaxID=2082722 RepID=A0ABR9T935_9SPHI|nr:SusC/RagA family TonB-linked outer membrane protein [Sphingobacterium pedocola]